MKKLFFTLLILLFALPAYAQQCSEENPYPQVARLGAGLGGGVPTSTVTKACDSVTDADIFCEDFEGAENCDTGDSNCRTTWDATTGGTSAVDTTTASVSSCTDRGTYQTNFSLVAGAGNVGCITETLSSHTVYVSFMVRINSDGITADTQSYYIARLYRAEDYAEYMILSVYRSGTDRKFQFKSRTATPTITGTTTIVDGTWYHIGLKYVRATAVELFVNGSSEGSDTIYDFSSPIGWILVGTGGNPGYSYNLDIDNIKLDDDTMPDSCTE